jgi:hypothetical protein
MMERRWRPWNGSRDRGKALTTFLCNLADCPDRGPPSGRRSELAVRNSESALPDWLPENNVRRQAGRSGHPQSDGEPSGRR